MFKSIKFKMVSGILALAGYLVLSGCDHPQPDDIMTANVNTPNSPDRIEVRQNIQFADIPVPRDFVLRRELCTSFQGSGMRFGKVVYDGTWNVSETGKWYIDEMKLTGWKFERTVFVGDYHTKHYFTAGKETAMVNIFHVKDITRAEVMINEDEAIRDAFRKEALKRRAIDGAFASQPRSALKSTVPVEAVAPMTPAPKPSTARSAPRALSKPTPVTATTSTTATRSSRNITVTPRAAEDY